MKLKKMLKTFLSDTNIVLADIDEPANINGYSKFFPTVFRGIKTLGTARELRGEVNSWRNIDNYEVVLAGIFGIKNGSIVKLFLYKKNVRTGRYSCVVQYDRGWSTWRGRPKEPRTVKAVKELLNFTNRIYEKQEEKE